jgi:hypothetical protein
VVAIDSKTVKVDAAMENTFEAIQAKNGKPM